MLSLWVVASLGLAQETVPVGADGFVVKLGDTTVSVEQAGVPFGVNLRNPDRVCRVRFDWTGSAVVRAWSTAAIPASPGRLKTYWTPGW